MYAILINRTINENDLGVLNRHMHSKGYQRKDAGNRVLCGITQLSMTFGEV